MNAVAPISVATDAPARRIHFCGSQLTSTRSVIRNQAPAAIALDSAASMLSFTATDAPGIGRCANTLPISTKKGLPGGCGIPSTYAAAMYSLASHIAVLGASVIRYRTKTASVAMPAARYEGL